MPNLAPIHNPRRTKHLTDKANAKRRSAKRQYATNSPTWRKLRATVLAEEPLCRECRREGIVKPARDVDHIDDDSFNNRRDNLAPLCHSHHSQKTAKEHGFKPNE